MKICIFFSSLGQKKLYLMNFKRIEIENCYIAARRITIMLCVHGAVVKSVLQYVYSFGRHGTCSNPARGEWIKYEKIVVQPRDHVA